jgi:adenylate cyclase
MLGSRALDVLTALVRHPGELMTKQALMEAAWGNVAVEESNLSVQISALRRALDEGRAGNSCLQTVIGRGYRFLSAVTVEASESALAQPPNESTEISASHRDPPLQMAPATGPRRRPALLLTLIAGLILAVFGLGAVMIGWSGGAARDGPTVPPRLSLAVLPFQNLSGDPGEDYLAEGVTDDLTTGLSHIPEAFVIASASTRTYKGRSVDPRQIGLELGVRYLVEGSTRRSGAALHVNVQLIATETGAQVWSDQFDEPIADLAAGQDAILARMRGTLGVNLIEIEIARGRRAPPSSPDAFDLILRARALRNLPQEPRRFDEALSLYEQALRLDPSSVLAMTGAATVLLQKPRSRYTWPMPTNDAHIAALVTRAREIAPLSEEVQGVYAHWVWSETGCRQGIPAARHMIDSFPNPTLGYGLLAECLIITGRSEEAIPLMEKVIRLNPRETYLAPRFSTIGSAHLFLGHYEEAIKWLERSLAVNPALPDGSPGGRRRKLAAALVLSGHEAEARRWLAAADKDWPFDTVRGHWPDDNNLVFAAQVRMYQEGLRRLGERDHADEDADFGVRPDATPHPDVVGYTPMTNPAAPTIRTPDLPRFIAEQHPVIIDPLSYFWGRSLPGAVGLGNAGFGGAISDDARERLRRVMADLTGGDASKPIIAVGWNSERFDGYNLALRLVALGYTNVRWYRGGREAWEVAGLPETDLTPQDW